jgi:tRNA(Arg) A34 adenosine deaminase TadA
VVDYVQRTIDIARNNVTAGGRPFATVIVRDGEILAESPNLVAQSHDPTAHAEILAIREACVRLGTEHLVGATIYVLAHPCPLCLGALHYCSPDEVVFLTTRDAYEPHYVDDRKILRARHVLSGVRQVVGAASSSDALRAAGGGRRGLPALATPQRRRPPRVRRAAF